MTTLAPLRHLVINDFTPGIWEPELHMAPAPIGAASQSDTFKCIALPGGGLGPLPRRVSGYSLPVPDANPRDGYYFVNGLRLISLDTKAFELHIGMTWPDASNNAKFAWYRYNTLTDTFTLVVNDTGTPSTYAATAFTSAVMRFTSAGNKANISVAGSWAATTGSGKIWYFPDPANPSSDTPSPDAAHQGQLFSHQGRILCFTPYTASHGVGVQTVTNEILNYTDPAQSTTMGSQETMLSPEAPYGYGAWGSVSAGELVLIKVASGGLITYDDIVFPRVIRLPAVQGTGAVAQEGSFCSLGMVYFARNTGAYVWNGNNTSRKISSQIPRNFAYPSDPTSVPHGSNPPVIFGDSVYISHTNWLDRVVFPNNWLFDVRTEGWWRLDDPNDTNITYWSALNNLLWGIEPFWTPGAPQALHTYQDTDANGVESFSWNSKFIPLGQFAGSKISIHEVEVLVQSRFTNATVVVTLTGEDGTSTTLTFTVPTSTQVVKLVKQLDTPLSVYGVNVKVVSNAPPGFIAPIIQAVTIAYSESRVVGSYWR